MINSPVAMDWDENGKIYVAEDTGYPLDTSPIYRIVLLEDTDGDGIPDRSACVSGQIPISWRPCPDGHNMGRRSTNGDVILPLRMIATDATR
jgi:hypothetical protein